MFELNLQFFGGRGSSSGGRGGGRMTSPRERGADLARFYTVTEPQRHPRGYTVYKVTARVSAVAGRGSESDQGRETGVDPGVGMPDARLRLLLGQAPEVGTLKRMR